jgi:hypothetical protein
VKPSQRTGMVVDAQSSAVPLDSPATQSSTGGSSMAAADSIAVSDMAVVTDLAVDSIPVANSIARYRPPQS